MADAIFIVAFVALLDMGMGMRISQSARDRVDSTRNQRQLHLSRHMACSGSCSFSSSAGGAARHAACQRQLANRIVDMQAFWIGKKASTLCQRPLRARGR